MSGSPCSATSAAGQPSPSTSPGPADVPGAAQRRRASIAVRPDDFCRFIVEHCHFDTNNDDSDHSGVGHGHARTTVHSHRSAPYTPPPPDAAGNPRHSVITAKQRAVGPPSPSRRTGLTAASCRVRPRRAPRRTPYRRSQLPPIGGQLPPIGGQPIHPLHPPFARHTKRIRGGTVIAGPEQSDSTHENPTLTGEFTK